MTCKDCIHSDVCKWNCLPPLAEQCEDFKDKSRYIEILCKVGDTVYQINATPYGGEVYELEIFDVSLIKGKPYYETEEIDFDNTAIGESIFLTREGAEAKLKGGAE